MYTRTYHVISLANRLNDYNPTVSVSFNNLNEAEIETKQWMEMYPDQRYYIVEVIAIAENIATYTPMIRYEWQF